MTIDKLAEARRGDTRHPKFGEWMRGIYASETNPIRDGMYVETIRRRGRLNPGTWYRLTDGKGKFWEFEAKATVFMQSHATEPAQPECDYTRLVAALRTQRQIDADGIEVGVSRQACDEAADIIESLAKAAQARPCTCHPDDNPPVPCPQKFAYSECAAAVQPQAAEPVAWRCTWSRWSQYHDETEPLPTKWDDDPPDQILPLYAHPPAQPQDARDAARYRWIKGNDNAFLLDEGFIDEQIAREASDAT